MNEICPYKDSCENLVTAAYVSIYCYDRERCQRCNYFNNKEVEAHKEAAKEW